VEIEDSIFSLMAFWAKNLPFQVVSREFRSFAIPVLSRLFWLLVDGLLS
jgi:hypothetical protein